MNLTNFAGQNWLITPAALAVGEHPPASIHDQKWLLVLTGVVTANLEGNSTSQWLNTNLSFLPDMAGSGGSGPLNWAIGQYNIPKPTGQGYAIAFSVDGWAPFVSLSAIYDQAQSIDAGYAVNVWRPNHFATGIDAFSNAPVGNIFTGVNVDVGVRDTDAWILSLGYNITLRGRIVFTKAPLIVFESNFETTPALQPPAPMQAVGTSTYNGAIEVVSPPFVHSGNWLRVGPYMAAGGSMFTGVFKEAPGAGIYSFSALVFVSSKSALSFIGFNSGTQEFLNLSFTNNRVDFFTQPTNCTYPSDLPFAIQITITVKTASATVQIAVAGTVANFPLPANSLLVDEVTFYQGAGSLGDAFYVNDAVVTYTAP
jgi:hypothetical protein